MKKEDERRCGTLPEVKNWRYSSFGFAVVVVSEGIVVAGLCFQ